MRIHRPRVKLLVALFALLGRAPAQTSPDLTRILERLDRLENENRALREEVRQLREQIQKTPEQIEKTPEQIQKTSASNQTPTLDERVEIEERRTAEQAETKVEASQRFPIRLTGMALFNAFYNSTHNGGVDYPTLAAPIAGGSANGGAVFRQSVIGLEYRGPQTFLGGQVHGSLFMDFFTGGSVSLANALRLRTASIGVDWKTRSLTFTQDKPLISPRDPDSLAQVGVPPLAGAGNLWWWEPQVRFEQRFGLGDQTGVRAQIAIIETDEGQAAVPIQYANSFYRARPGLEGRAEFFHQFSGERRIEIAPGFHRSETHVADGSVPSRVFTTDWLLRPLSPVEITGFFFTGQNVAHLGTAGIRQGFSILEPQRILPVHSRGGWTQLKLVATPRLSFHLMAGIHDDRASDVLAGLGAQGPAGGVGRNLAYGANFYYKLAPNVILSYESSQVRTSYLLLGRRINNHYDLALAYLF